MKCREKRERGRKEERKEKERKQPPVIRDYSFSTNLLLTFLEIIDSVKMFFIELCVSSESMLMWPLEELMSVHGINQRSAYYIILVFARLSSKMQCLSHKSQIC